VVSARIVCEEIANALTLRVPLECDAGVGADWFTAK
jgi:DNA polymerase I-like protein with 3'-5' exonuclease and polymerase domains